MMFALPDDVQDVIQRETAPFSLSELRVTAESLSSRYRSRDGIRLTLSPIERAAYLGVRFPSTFSAAAQVWRRLAERWGDLKIRSLLDVGAGPGTASLACVEQFGPLHATLLERDAGWQQVATRLADVMHAPSTFRCGSMESSFDGDAFDAVVACYSLNELPSPALLATITRLWSLTDRFLIVIEPGTPAGFSSVKAARESILSRGGHVVAPCTHEMACPLMPNDWCHSALRVKRTSLHRELKDGSLSYEDEKISYAVFSRAAPPVAGSGRIVRRPIRGKGHIHFDLCRHGDIERVTISKKQGERYRQAKDADWGDLLSD